MRLICYWHRRRLLRQLVLDEPILPESSLAKHLAHCDTCAQARRDFTFLQDLLPRVSPEPTLSSDFEARLRVRLKQALEPQLQAASMPRYDWGRHGKRFLGTGLTFAAAAAIAVFLWLPRQGHGVTQDAAWLANHIGLLRRDAQFANNVRQSRPSTYVLPPKHYRGQEAVVKSDAVVHHRGVAYLPHHTMRIAWTRSTGGHIRRHHHHLRIRGLRAQEYARARANGVGSKHRRIDSPAVAGLGNTSSVATELQVSFTAPTWSDAGGAYETIGDHSRASEAYGRAFTERADADLAIAASENAQAAGDTSQSLEYCAAALR